MSASQWDWSPASADGLLTNEECFKLLDVDVFDDDLFKSFPATPKVESVNLVPTASQDELSASLYPPSPPETKPSRAELATDLLQQIENQCKQENIFPNWLEEKVELPIFEHINQVRSDAAAEQAAMAALAYCAPAPAAPLAAAAGPQHTEELLREFESVYGAVELTHLTPPASPPGPATQLLLSYAQQAQCVPAPAPAPLQGEWALLPPYEGSCSSLSVDELVRDRAAELSSPPASSPPSSSPSSPRSSSTDDEWSAGGSHSYSHSRSKPYSRGTDDRRSRKKEQNKNAATRYRQKKKAEIEVLLNEEQSLRQRHTELGDKCSDLQREIRYLKGLMRDLFKAKGLIK